MSTFKERSDTRQTNIRYLREIIEHYDDISNKLLEIIEERNKCKNNITKSCKENIGKLFLYISEKIDLIDSKIKGVKDVPLTGGGLLSYSIKHKRESMASQIKRVSTIIKETIPKIKDKDMTAKQRSIIALTLLKELQIFWSGILLPDLIEKKLLLKDSILMNELRKKEVKNLIEEHKFNKEMSSLHTPK